MKTVLDFRRLRYFAAIAEHGSLSGAARALNVAQPALSHHIGEIETQLGLKLLRRHRDGVTLTDGGDVLRRHALDIIERVEQTHNELLAMATARPAPTRLHLAIISSIAADLTPALLEEFGRGMPGISLRITEAGTLDSLELVKEGKVDLAISLAPFGPSTPVAWERLHLVCCEEGVGPSAEIPFAKVLCLPLILPARGNPLRELLEAEATQFGRRLDVVVEIDGPTSRIKALSSGQGSTILGATSTVELVRVAGLAVRPIILPSVRRPLFMAARRGLPAKVVEVAGTTLAAALASLRSLDTG